MGNHSLGIINKWLRNIKDVYRIHRDEIDKIENEEERTNKLIEFNVSEQIMNLAKTSIIQKAWKHDQRPHLHGWVYGLNSGYVTDLKVNISSNKDLDEVYRLKF